MSAFENAKKFFDACETGAGWDGCRQLLDCGITMPLSYPPEAGGSGQKL